MRQPTADDIIYTGLALRLGLVTRESLRTITNNPAYNSCTLIDALFRENVISIAQHEEIQKSLRALSDMALFKAVEPEEAAHKPLDPMDIPTIRFGDPEPEAGTAGQPLQPQQPAPAQPQPQTATQPQTLEPQAPGAAAFAPAPDEAPTVPGAPRPLQGQPVHPDTAFSEAATKLGETGSLPPRSAESSGIGTGSVIGTGSGEFSSSTSSQPTETGTINWTEFTDTLTHDDISRAETSRRKNPKSMVGQKLGAHVLIDRLGRGGMGDVYLAKQLTLNRYVALKVLPKALALRPDFIRRFIKEAQTLARLNFPSVTQVYDVGQVGEVVYFTMELVRGKTIGDMIRENERVPLPLTINVIKQSCRSLARVAKEGIIHRDIKPANIMVTDEGEVKVCDFGIAADHLDESIMKEIVGTPTYIAPEYLTGDGCDSRSDQYALGVTMHHMLGGYPLERPSPAGYMGELPPLSDMDVNIPEEIEAVAHRMAKFNPADRFADFEEIFNTLEAWELKKGLIKAPSEFLADRLSAMRELGVDDLKRAMAVMGALTAGLTASAVMLNMILITAGLRSWIGMSGGISTILIFTAYMMILYVGLARKRRLPAMGNLRTWVITHYNIALSGYFLAMVHSGNFIATPMVKNMLGSVPGLGAEKWNTIPTVAFLSSAALFVVIFSGLVGRHIFKRLHTQLALERLAGKKGTADERQEITRIVIGTRIMSYWRILHYPFTLFMILLLALHIGSTMYYGASFFGG